MGGGRGMSLGMLWVPWDTRDRHFLDVSSSDWAILRVHCRICERAPFHTDRTREKPEAELVSSCCVTSIWLLEEAYGLTVTPRGVSLSRCRGLGKGL